MIDKAQVREALTGPIPSIRTPFTRDGKLDVDGLRRQIDFDLAAGCRTIMLTAGDSHYFALSDAEIGELTRATVQHVAGRAMTVVADRQYDTGQALAFAEFARDTGADVYMVLPPDWGKSVTATGFAGHYAALARVIPVMLVTNVFAPRGDAFGLDVVHRTLALSDTVVAIKDDICGGFARQLALLAGDRCAVFAGGQKQNHMNMLPYGCCGYLSSFISFRPDITRQYWTAIQAGDLAAAATVIRERDMPYFALIAGLPGGFDAGIHGTLELAGICGRWRRPPYHSLTDAEMETLRQGLADIGALP
jgi:dihydrodipicolinate synthase/N-acetylneuraminate lyase